MYPQVIIMGSAKKITPGITLPIQSGFLIKMFEEKIVPEKTLDNTKVIEVDCFS